MYNRLVEVMDILALLVDKQSLTDVTILKVCVFIYKVYTCVHVAFGVSVIFSWCNAILC